MRIVLAGSSFVHDGGGIASYNRELCRALVERGNELLIITAEDVDTTEWKLGEHKTTPVYSTIIPKYVSDEIKVARKMFDRIIEFDPHVLISSDHIYLTSTFPCFADNRIRISISHSYNGIIPKTAACRPKETDWIVALSYAGKKYLSSLPNCCETQIVVVYNSVHDITINIADNILKKSFDDVLRIVYPGGNARLKSPNVVLKMVNLLAESDLNWELTWLGSAENFKRRVSNKGRNRILFTGRVTSTEARKHILKSHCYVLPSRLEACPMSLVEAMNGGIIPLVSDCPSAMKEIVEHGISGFVVPVGDYRKLVAYLIKIGRSEELRRSLMKESRNAYEKHLDFNIWIEKMMELIKHRRKSRIELKNTDEFDPKMVYRWHRRPGRWWLPTPSYIRIKLGHPNLSPLLNDR